MYGFQWKICAAAGFMTFMLLSGIVIILRNPTLSITILSREENTSFLLHQTGEQGKYNVTLLREQRDAISRQLNLLQVRMR